MNKERILDLMKSIRTNLDELEEALSKESTPEEVQTTPKPVANPAIFGVQSTLTQGYLRGITHDGKPDYTQYAEEAALYTLAKAWSLCYANERVVLLEPNGNLSFRLIGYLNGGVHSQQTTETEPAVISRAGLLKLNNPNVKINVEVYLDEKRIGYLNPSGYGVSAEWW